MTLRDDFGQQLTLMLDSQTPGMLVITGSASPSSVGDHVDLAWDLCDCETAAERAGLAGLALLSDWATKQPDFNGTLELQVDETSLRLALDASALNYLFKVLYQWAPFERRSYSKNGAVYRTEEEINPETGKKRTVYYWKQDQPVLRILQDPDICPEGGEAWLSLNRELLWRLLYSNQKARQPFYEGIDVEKLIRELRENKRQKISGSSLLTAGSRSAERVEFRKSAQQAFLLRFWPLVAQVFVIAEAEVDRSAQKVSVRVKDKRAIAIPDVADLRRFTRYWHKLMRQRSTDMQGIYPAAAVIDLPAEAALIGFSDFRQVEQAEVGRQVVQVPSALLGFEVICLEKTSQSPRLHGVLSIAPERAQIDAYAALRSKLRHGLLRPQVLANAIAGRSLWSGVSRLVRIAPIAATIGEVKNPSFDSKNFHEDCKIMTEYNETAQRIRKILNAYLHDRMNSVGGKTEGKLDPEKWNREINRTFNDVRGLPDEQFTSWFSRYLGAYTSLGSEGVAEVVNILYSNSKLCRELTLICLGSLRRLERNGSASEVDQLVTT